ncbi:hypothetical protein D3C86_2063940 [compost metagenome]
MRRELGLIDPLTIGQPIATPGSMVKADFIMVKFTPRVACQQRRLNDVQPILAGWCDARQRQTLVDNGNAGFGKHKVENQTAGRIA